MYDNNINDFAGHSHGQHAFTHEWIRDFLFKRFGWDVWDMPMCNKCERVAFWHKDDSAMCPHCGNHTLNPITVGEYYKNQYHKSGFARQGQKIMEVLPNAQVIRFEQNKI